MPNQAKDDKASSSKSSSSSASNKGGNNSASQRGQTVSSSKPSSSGGNNSASQRGATVSSSKPSASSPASKPSVSSSKSSFAGQERSGTGRSYSPPSSQGGGAQNSASQRGAVVSASRPAAQPSIGKGFAAAYRQVADTARSVGINSIGGAQTPARPASPMGGFRQTEIQSMNNLYGYEKEAVKVLSAGPGWTQVELRDGTVETRKGDRASRNHNPGNIEYGDFAKSVGAIGTDGRFATFPDKATGLKAIESLLDRPTYRDLTISGAIQRYAPPHENDTAGYASTVAAAAGATPGTKLSDLSPAQRTSMVEAMTRVEGNTGYKTTTNVVGQGYGTPPSGAVIKGDRQYAATPSVGPAPSSRPAASSAQMAARTGGYVDPMVVKVDAPAPVRTVETFKEKYLSTPAAGPTPAAKPQTQVADAPKELTTGQKIAAGAIDIGAGFIPVVGTGLGVVNAGLQLTGNQTLGQRIVAGIGEGGGGGAQPIGQGQDRDYNVAKAEPEAEPAQTASTDAAVIIPTYERFVNTYIGPTPDQKWARA